MTASTAWHERQLPGPAPSAAAIIRRHSASFALASRVLAPGARHHAHALYAYCRRADDAIDCTPPGLERAALVRLRAELDVIYAGQPLHDPIAAEFQRLVFERHIPRAYPDGLLDGFELDVQGVRYASLLDLQRYCWCVAGTVGAMMCHVMGVRHQRAVVHGVHLGMAMQLTNICRDVAEDWRRGRLYIPAELLGDLSAPSDWPPSADASRQLARAVERLLQEADILYRSGDAGLGHLTFRSRVAVATARHVYSSIGRRLRNRGCDVLAGRAVVPLPSKLWCVARAAYDALSAKSAPSRERASILQPLVRFPEDVLPV